MSRGGSLLHQLNQAARHDFLAGHKGRNAGTPPPEKPQEPILKRYVVDDITIQALAERLESAPRGLLSASDELATWLGSFNAYRSKCGGDVGRWLSVHQAQPLLVDRKTGQKKTIFIPHAAVSLTGAIQPATLRRLLGVEHFENGLVARLLLASPPRHGRRWSDEIVDSELTSRVRVVFGRLLALDFDTDANGCPAPVDLCLSPEAASVWKEFYDQHAREQESLTGALAAAFAKLEAYAARFALVVHLVRCATDDPTLPDPTTVDEQSVSAGITLARWFWYETKRTYLMLQESDEQREQRHLIELIRKRGGYITPNDLRRRNRRLATSEDAERAMAQLVDAGIGHWRHVTHGCQGGRPTREFVLNEAASVSETPLIPEQQAGLGYGNDRKAPTDAK